MEIIVNGKSHEVSKGRPAYVLVIRKAAILPVLVILAFVAWTAFVGTRVVVADAAYRVRCSNFKYQEEAQAEYERGSKQLDGNDRDGKACEHLPNKK